MTTYTYRFPRVTNWGRIADAVLSAWEASGITRFQSGNQFTVTGNTAIGIRRADYLGGEIELPSDERTVNRWFNTAAFAAAPESRLGTAGVRSVKGPGLQLWDLSLRKRLAQTETWRLQFQADFFNLFNKTELPERRHYRDEPRLRHDHERRAGAQHPARAAPDVLIGGCTSPIF